MDIASPYSIRPLPPYVIWKNYFGDLHNHCGISYDHGTLDEALANAREQLDFCAVTGHAHWPDMPATGDVWADINGRRVVVPLKRLLRGAYADMLGGVDSPAYRFHRCPLSWEYEWSVSLDDEGAGRDAYYVRVRQKNDQWAWSSPVFLREDIRAVV